jgi:hypothetical protein
MPRIEIESVVRVTVESILPNRIIVRTLEGTEGFAEWPEVSWDSRGSDMAWLAVGSEVDVLVMALIEGGPFVGSFRRVHPEFDPWARVDDLVVGNVVEGTVFSFTSWGAMVRLRPGLYAGWRDSSDEVGALGSRHSMVIEMVDFANHVIVVSKLRGNGCLTGQ